MIPAKAIIHKDVAVKKHPIPMAQYYPIRESRYGTIITIALLQFWNQPTKSEYK